MVPADVSGGVRIKAPLTPEQDAFIQEHLKNARDAAKKKKLAMLAVEAQTAIWTGGLSLLARPSSEDTDANILAGKYPIAKFDRPSTGPGDPYAGKPYGLFYTKEPDGSAVIRFDIYAPRDSGGFFEGIWSGIMKVAASVVIDVTDAVFDVVSAVADLACEVAQHPAGTVAGAAVGTVVGGAGGAQAGAAGAELARAACYKPPPAVPLVSVTGGSSSAILPVAIAGGIVLAAILFLEGKVQVMNARDLLTKLGIGNFNATMIIQYMFIAPATTDPKSPPIILLVKHVQKALNKLGARIRETGYLDTATANALSQVVGPRWEQRSWADNVASVLTALKSDLMSTSTDELEDAPIATIPKTSLGFIDLPHVPGGIFTYGAAGALAYYLWKKRSR